MSISNLPEVWLRGAVAGIAPLLQPVAHALLQSREEVSAFMSGFPEDQLWERTAGVASPGYHLQHMAGVLDRLFTYASGNALTEQQLKALAVEGQPPGTESSLQALLMQYSEQVNRALDQLYNTNEQTLLEPRSVGRAKLPSNVLGLLFHAAEHMQRHTGQLLVTVRVLSQ